MPKIIGGLLATIIDNYRLMKGWSMENLELVLLFVISAGILAPIVFVLGLWLKSATSLAFPTLGLILPTLMIVISLTVTEVVMVVLAAYLVRNMPMVRLTSGEGA
jgi:hypothetical protein